jgi:hypothetical protein
MVHEGLAREERQGVVVEFGCGAGFYSDILAAGSDG